MAIPHPGTPDHSRVAAPGREVSSRSPHEAAYTRVAIAVTSSIAALWLAKTGLLVWSLARVGHLRIALLDAVLIPGIALFFFGQLVYLFCRLGFLMRAQSHRLASRREIESIYQRDHPPPLTILIPAYREDPEVVRKTILSAALLEYPDRRVVLLIDDPPLPDSAAAASNLAAMRDLGKVVSSILHPIAARLTAACRHFEARVAADSIDVAVERGYLGQFYTEAADWIASLSGEFACGDHADRLFVEEILLKPAARMRARADELARAGTLSPREIAHEYRRLASLFAVRISSFERKQFANLSHAASKAMNLNSYLGLIGKNFHIVAKPDGNHLEECDASDAQLEVPNADYIIVVDADTLIVNDYAMRLVHVMEQEENRRVAIAQSPHRPMLGTPIVLERAAGAQTDIQRILCQGSAHYGAAFWVGGSALMRRAALEDVCELAVERGYTIRKYIQDRTLVEDTESSLGFLAKGWSIYNYLDPLSYSMIPGDFGALIVQRSRWSSGGLLNLPALGEYLRVAEHRWRRIPEGLLRFHYLASTTVNLGMLLLPLIVASDSTPSGWLLLTAPIYYALYARDLFSCGYSWIDLPRVYALNLLLVPVSLHGVFNSFRQWWTGRKPVFRRTPKIRERTAIPLPYLVALWTIPPVTMVVAMLDLIAGGISVALLGVFNAIILAICVIQFVGLRETLDDLYAVVLRTGREFTARIDAVVAEEKSAPALD